MHPILSQTRRLGLYLLAWFPLAALVLYLLARNGQMGIGEAALFSIVICYVYAFMCPSAWYTCRATPIETSSFSRLLGTHLIAAMTLSLFWLTIATILAVGLSFIPTFHGLAERVKQLNPLLWTLGILLYLLSVGLHYVLIALEASRAAEQRESAARILARDAELRALKAQINPHFIFNSLHSISALTSMDAGRARDMCISLSEFLRLTLGMGEKSAIPLSEELALLHKYLAIEKIRFGARLEMKEEVQPQTLDCVVPPLLLQPLIENAVSHGISHLPEGGWIRLDIQQPDPQSVHIEVENTFDPDSPPRRKNGMGLKIVQQRIEARFGAQGVFTCNKDENRFRVTMDFPAERNTA